MSPGSRNVTSLKCVHCVSHSHPAGEGSISLSLRPLWNNAILLNTATGDHRHPHMSLLTLIFLKIPLVYLLGNMMFPPNVLSHQGSNFASQSSGSTKKGSSVGSPQAVSGVLLGPSSISLALLHGFDKFLDLFLQGPVPLLNILTGALHVAEGNFQG